jgi:hypothetical protein
MKRYISAAFLTVIIGTIGALDTESYQFIDHLLGIQRPGPPELYEDGVIFTAPSTYRRVGIAFAHEGFSRIYWFQKLLFVKDNGPPPARGKPPPEQYQDSGVLFYVYTPPQDEGDLEYRLIIDGLWVKDPLNPLSRRDGSSGIIRSVVSLPEYEIPHSVSGGSPGSLSFRYEAPPGETITVAGSFNGWDPFMYELRENSPGRYSLTLPVPPGTYQYAFYHRGERFTDPYNYNLVYTGDGKSASEAVVN